jgi:glycerol-3-phosphate dehydrogenase (NAD(P)+)
VTKVAVLGAGSWGTTVAAQLSERVGTVLWARDPAIAREIDEQGTNRAYLGTTALPSSLRGTSSIAEALDGASLVVLAVPAKGLRPVLEEAASAGAAGSRIPVLSLVKGMEVDTLLRPSQIVAQCLGQCPLAVLTGPNLAMEILEGQPSASVVASSDEALALDLQGLLSSATLRIYTNHDVVGCEVAGVVKNVMAIATGMATGLGFGDNTRAALVTRALAELTRLGVCLGGEAATFAGLAGVGDLVATCTSPRSRNFAVGLALGQGKRLEEILGAMRTVAEGVTSCGPVVSLARRHGVEAPVAEQVVAVCQEGMDPREAIPRLMGRAPRAE